MLSCSSKGHFAKELIIHSRLAENQELHFAMEGVCLACCTFKAFWSDYSACMLVELLLSSADFTPPSHRCPTGAFFGPFSNFCFVSLVQAFDSIVSENFDKVVQKGFVNVGIFLTENLQKAGHDSLRLSDSIPMKVTKHSVN